MIIKYSNAAETEAAQKHQGRCPLLLSIHFALFSPAAVGKYRPLPKNPELFGFHSTLSEAGLLFLFILVLFPLKVIGLGF